jgi:hypothetical protein
MQGLAQPKRVPDPGSSGETTRRDTTRKSGGVSLRAILELLGDHLAGGIFAPTTASPDGKLALHFKQRASPVVDGVADLTITDCVADAYVHLQPLTPPSLDGPCFQ